jgi:predicted HicB family RNase H-like nuclease
MLLSQMPGHSHRGPLPPLRPEEVWLEARLAGHVSALAGDVGERNVWTPGSLTAAANAFQEAVDFYLETCAERGEQPNKPYSGKLLVRMPVETHEAVATMAEVHGKSINQWIVEILEKETTRCCQGEAWGVRTFWGSTPRSLKGEGALGWK